ncbi:MAG TPA: hypothetical protein VFX92_00710 [Candidatus Krumholzibacteria bacterium]|nr:hypothetical protein [Candidatus Krumholzibacteria bacterium]
MRPLIVLILLLVAGASQAAERAPTEGSTHDPGESQGRNVVGPLSPEEYAVYQIVIDRAIHDKLFPDPELRWFVITPSEDAGVYSEMDSSVELLGTADDTMAGYLMNRSMQSDMASLSMLGYDILASDAHGGERKKSAAPGAWGCQVRVSRIGFNAAGDQALVYCEHGCGALSSVGEVILLDRVNGEWRVKKSVALWMS